MNKDKINIGDWISCDGEGFGVVTKMHPFYWDVFCKELYGAEREYYMDVYDDEDPPALGELCTIIVQCKRFCNYDGTPIRSHKMRSCHIRSAKKVNDKDMAIINKAIQQYPKEYASFLKFDRRLNTYFEVDFLVDNYEEAKFAEELFRNKILKQLPKKFTSIELKEAMESNNCPFKLDEPVRWNPSGGSRYSVELIFFYTIGDYRGKDTLYYHVNLWYPGKKYDD